MKHLLVLLMITSISGLAQSVPESELKQALQFRWNGSYGFSSFSGSTMSYKKMISPEKESRLSLSIGGNYLSDNGDRNDANEYYEADTTISTSSNDTRNSDKLDITLGYYRLKHKHSIKQVSVYYGGGPFIQLDMEGDERTQESIRDTVLTSNVTKGSNFNYSAGLNSIVGWEWRVNKVIGITAEYGTTLRISKMAITVEQKRNEISYNSSIEDDTNRLFISLSSGTKIGVSLYF